MNGVGGVVDLVAELAEEFVGLRPGVVVEAEQYCKLNTNKVVSKLRIMIRRLAVGDQQ